ncbi:MAG: hypothetical protein ACRDNW_02290 [Trebonia sp.]
MRSATKILGIGLLATTAAIGSLTVPAAASTTGTAVTARAAGASAGTGFGYGTDSWPIRNTSSAPYQEPVIGGNYGGYMWMTGNWARTEGCKTGNFLAWAPASAYQANTNYAKYHLGVGVGAYWYMGGPGVDPHWNGTTTEAYRWGEQQAAWTLATMKGRYVPYPVIWADIELPGIAPAPDNGWNSVYTSPCSGRVRQSYVPANVDRADFNGYAAYITTHSTYKVGVYSSPQIWPRIFGTGVDSKIPNTYEWTYTAETPRLSPAPAGWCLRGIYTCAEFFGGQTSSSKYALMWQWSGGGGVSNGYGDFDQIDIARMK